MQGCEGEGMRVKVRGTRVLVPEYEGISSGVREYKCPGYEGESPGYEGEGMKVKVRGTRVV